MNHVLHILLIVLAVIGALVVLYGIDCIGGGIAPIERYDFDAFDKDKR